MAIFRIAPRAAALAATVALLAPGAVLAQASQDATSQNSLTADQLNQQMLMTIQQDPLALLPEDGSMMSSGAMMDTSGLTDAERMGLLDARFDKVSSRLYAAERGDIVLSDDEVAQLQQYREALAQELQVMADAGVQPVLPSGGTTGADMTTTGRVDSMAGSSMQPTAMMGNDVQIFEDQAGNQYVRADVYDRMAMAQGGGMTSSSPQSFVDQQGVRYYRLDATDQSMMMGSAGVTSSGATLDETLDDPSLRTNPAYEDEVEIFEDEAGNRFMQVGADNRIVGAPAGSAMASMDVSGYPIYQDAQGNRYIRVDANNQPMMTSAVQ